MSKAVDLGRHAASIDARTVSLRVHENHILEELVAAASRETWPNVSVLLNYLRLVVVSVSSRLSVAIG